MEVFFMTYSTILGYPRIGANRELKKSLESYWKGEIAATALESTAKELRAKHWQTVQAAGIDHIPSGDFAYYDQVLDQTVALGALPERYVKAASTPLDQYFAAARGTQDVPALEMTKWLNTNYHYIVPELAADQAFTANPSKYVAHYQEAKKLGIETRPVLIGPVSYLLLSKRADGGDTLALLDAILPAYCSLLRSLADAGAKWVQLDEPYLVTKLSPDAARAYHTAYKALREAAPVKLFVTSYFDRIRDNADLALSLPVDALHFDLTYGDEELARILAEAPKECILSLGLIDGRNIWRADLDKGLKLAEKAVKARGADKVWISSSCSLLHVPYDLAGEDKLPDGLGEWLAFAKQKLDEITALNQAASGTDSNSILLFAQNRNALDKRRQSPATFNKTVRERLAAISPSQLSRKSAFDTRQKVQAERFDLPLFPTTTIGSFPQTAEVRQARAKYNKGELSAADYRTFLQEKTVETLRIQEELDIDVLVHGEFERTDMVEYFGEQLQGFAFTRNGWVQSYGSRCVKPPVIYGDVWRKQPITVEWSRFAQSQTKRPLKGMLTGPVTILQWSFVRDDQPRKDSCTQIGLALRDEVVDLEAAGIGLIQIDEPALREGLPLHVSQRADYLEWAVNAFRLSAAGVDDSTQIHTHMCYGDFEEIIESIAALDADVISIETSRSQLELLDCFKTYEYPNAIGPGVYDIHSPRVPGHAEILTLLRGALNYIQPERLWVNPDCGLKTRAWPETKAALKVMVDAAKTLRDEVAAKSLKKAG